MSEECTSEPTLAAVQAPDSDCEPTVLRRTEAVDGELERLRGVVEDLRLRLSRAEADRDLATARAEDLQRRLSRLSEVLLEAVDLARSDSREATGPYRPGAILQPLSSPVADLPGAQATPVVQANGAPSPRPGATSKAPSRRRRDWPATAWRVWSIGLTALSVLLLAVFAAVEVGPSVIPYQLLVMSGPSMEPAIPADALMLALPTAPESLAVGDVVLIEETGLENAAMGRRVVEVVATTDGWAARVEADASQAPDPQLVRFSGVAWRLRYQIPVLGRAILFGEQPLGRIILLVAPSLVAIRLVLLLLLRTPVLGGIRQSVLCALAGAALYGGLSWLSDVYPIGPSSDLDIRPGVAVPILFGLVFGPVPGLISGLLGNVLGDLASGFLSYPPDQASGNALLDLARGLWPHWQVGNGLIGLVPGLMPLGGRWDRSLAAQLGRLGLAGLGVVVGIGFAALVDVTLGIRSPTAELVESFLPVVWVNLLSAAVLAPILLFDVARLGRTGAHRPR